MEGINNNKMGYPYVYIKLEKGRIDRTTLRSLAHNDPTLLPIAFLDKLAERFIETPAAVAAVERLQQGSCPVSQSLYRSLHHHRATSTKIALSRRMVFIGTFFVHVSPQIIHAFYYDLHTCWSSVPY